MPGLFYEHEVQLSPDTCGCTLARDSSLTGEAHRLSAQYVVQCPTHIDAGASAIEVHQHNVSKNVMVAALIAALPDNAWVIGTDKNGQPVKTIVEPVEYLLSPKTGQIAIRHSLADAVILAKVAQDLKAHPLANLSLANEPTAASVFSAKDAMPSDDGKPVFWKIGKDGNAIISQDATTIATVI